MTLGEHLEELRRRIILALLGVVPIFVTALAFGRPILAFLIEPLRDELRAASQPSGLLATGPFETFAVYLQISFIATILLGSPWLLYQLWMFVAPGLYSRERRFVHILVPLSTILTVVSAAFLYLVVLRVILAFFIGFGTQLGQSHTPVVELPPGVVLPQVPVLRGDPPDPQPGQLWINTDTMQLRTAVPTADGVIARVGSELVAGAGITQQYRVSEYVKTVLNLALAFGVGFQTPVVVLLLGWAGIVGRDWLRRYRRQAVAVSVVAGAVLTPADPLSMILLAVPLYLLFELGMLLLIVFPPGRDRREPPDAGDEDATETNPGPLTEPTDDDPAR
jgi:sec-independent protein translocase protein TatC